ncbi:MAG: secretion protein [Phycisphaerales bacterium]
MFTRTHAISTLAALTLAAGASAQSFHNLGAITPTGVSADGSVVAASVFQGSFFVWTEASGLVNIGGNAVAGNASISDDGTKIGGTIVDPGTGLSEFAQYVIADGTWTPLGGLGASCDNSVSSGWGMSGDGEMVVGLGWVANCRAHGISWSASTGVVDLGSTVPDRSSRANAANFDGSVIVGWQDGSTGFRQGAVWRNGVQSLIFTNTGGLISEASGVSADGTWIIGNGSSSNGFNAWRYSDDTGFETIGMPPSFGWRGASTAISADGSVIVGFYRPFPGPATFGQGFIWTQADGMINLNDFVASQGVNTEGVTLALPLGISADGRTIVGLGSGGVGFVVTLPQASDCPGDVTGSGGVDLADLNLVLANFGQTTDAGDANGDGVVDLADLNTVLANFGITCD